MAVANGGNLSREFPATARQDIEARLIDGAIGQPAGLALALEGLDAAAVNAPDTAGTKNIGLGPWG